MRQIAALIRKELRVYFVSPQAYVIMVVFLLLTGYSFSQLLLNYQRVDFYPRMTREMAKLLLILVPILTMRLLAEEARMGSFILLLTAPVTETQIVLAKFGAGALFVLAMILPTAAYPVLLFRCGDPDLGPILAGYLGLVLAGLTFVAIGLFASSLTETPVASAVIAIGISLALWMTAHLEEIVGPTLGKVLGSFSLNTPLFEFCYGIVYLNHVFLYLSLTVLFLFATVRILRGNRWG